MHTKKTKSKAPARMNDYFDWCQHANFFWIRILQLSRNWTKMNHITTSPACKKLGWQVGPCNAFCCCQNTHAAGICCTGRNFSFRNILVWKGMLHSAGTRRSQKAQRCPAVMHRPPRHQNVAFWQCGGQMAYTTFWWFCGFRLRVECVRCAGPLWFMTIKMLTSLPPEVENWKLKNQKN